MPLPLRVDCTDLCAGSAKTVHVKTVEAKPGDYRPTDDYYPTRIIVKCSGCGGVGVAEFPGGFNLREGDKLMAGRSIRGICFSCQRETDLVPLKEMAEKSKKELFHLYDLQRTIDLYRRENGDIPRVGVMIPYARAKLYAERREDAEQTKL